MTNTGHVQLVQLHSPESADCQSVPAESPRLTIFFIRMLQEETWPN